MRSTIRQLKYPKEFRIQAPTWSGDIRVLLHEVADLLRMPQKGTGGLDRKAIADLGTGLWRLRLKMITPDTGRPLEEMRRAYRHFESVWDALNSEGVKIYDHTGQAYEPGRALQVISFQPTSGLSRDMIIETIKPTIYLNDDLIQTGEVIVGTPEGLSEKQ